MFQGLSRDSLILTCLLYLLLIFCYVSSDSLIIFVLIFSFMESSCNSLLVLVLALNCVAWFVRLVFCSGVGLHFSGKFAGFAHCLGLDPHFLEGDDHDHSECGHDHHHDHEHHHDHGHNHHNHHGHTDRIQSFVFKSDKPFDHRKLEDFLGGVLSVFGEKMLRYKGVLYVKGSARKVVLQGVHEMMGSDLAGPWGAEPKQTRMVFIGIDLPKDTLLAGLEGCLSN